MLPAFGQGGQQGTRSNVGGRGAEGGGYCVTHALYGYFDNMSLVVTPVFVLRRALRPRHCSVTR